MPVRHSRLVQKVTCGSAGVRMVTQACGFVLQKWHMHEQSVNTPRACYTDYSLSLQPVPRWRAPSPLANLHSVVLQNGGVQTLLTSLFCAAFVCLLSHDKVRVAVQHTAVYLSTSSM